MEGIGRVRSDAAAMRYHLTTGASHGRALVVIGGTGTGKSTLVNRLLQANLSATSFRRTFTSGAVGIVAAIDQLSPVWLGESHELQADPPAKGQSDRLTLLTFDSPLTRSLALIDTPDLDGDNPAHHAVADQAFRWANALLFLVSPEKYQMTELQPYYDLAGRYEVPAVFVMNKCESAQQFEDYRKLLPENASVFAVPRDDALWASPADTNLDALRSALPSLPAPACPAGLTARCKDLAGRLVDQVLARLESSRRQADRARAALLAMDRPLPEVDVHPITQAVQKRMNERSVLYLIGPQRILDRVRQAPGFLARLPRSTWDLVMRGKLPNAADSPSGPASLPDFRSILVDEFTALRSRIDDQTRAAGVDPLLLESTQYKQLLIDPAEAGKIADEELASLKAWLEERWNKTPRDTAMLVNLLKYLPGGKQVIRLSEAAPYLLTLVVISHHAMFGHVDLIVLGSWSLFTWLTEKLSNEVTARARLANQRLTERFGQLAEKQVEQIDRFLRASAPDRQALADLQNLAQQLNDVSFT